MFYPNCTQKMDFSLHDVTEIQSVSASDIRNGDVFTSNELKEVAIKDNSASLPLPADTELQRQLDLGIIPQDYSYGTFIHGEKPMLNDEQAEQFYNKLTEEPKTE